ncbi:hypothetical protein [Serpentinicella alkaliphila]|uniref:Uncharacterized protein n=1 Tax=Serpentinicella alkaliphila TaxID=1734049 RepID=A0A4R2U101_9FIRM|nr:hypothetical protein [Serpentinicella alkaliphila]QUH24700.1 hypothetical protein HZR23_02090 [Serpentinicella alkaliphila]TCQ03689.1 hypothetical protein EDD79_10084 [Serpentinicella alkaliphila]
MNLDVNITIEDSLVTLNIRDLSIKESIHGIIMFNKKGNILNVGETEQNFKESIIGTLPSRKSENTSFVEFPEMHKMFKELLNMSYEDTVRLCKEDPINGPNIVWERLRDNINFVYPFDLENPDYNYMALFINYNLIILTEEKYKGEGFIKSFLRAFFLKYSLNIHFKEYVSLNPQQKNSLKKELGAALKRQIKVKELIINGDYI